MAFKRIKICLTDPICNCDEQDLIWGVTKDTNNKISLIISCSACKTQLFIPHDKFIAVFDLDRPYPDKANTTKDNSNRENNQSSSTPLDPFFLRYEAQMKKPAKKT